MYRNNQRINALPHFIRAIALLIIAGLSFATIGKGSFPIFFATGKNREFETVAEFSPGEATGVEFNLSSSELVVQSSEEVDNVVLQVSFYKKIKDETINKEQNWLRDGRIYLTDDVNPLAERSGRNWLQRHLYGYRILVPQNTSSFEVDFVSQSGELEIKDVNCGSVSAIISSGDVVLNQVEAKMIDVQSTSGDLELYDCKADRFSMQTTSGDIEGDLLTGVQIHGTTTSGDLELNQVSAEDLVLSAESGDIDCNVKYVPNTFAVKTSSGDAVIHFDLMGIKDDTINKVSPKYMSVATSSGDVTIKNTPEWLQVDVSDSKQFFTRGHNDSKEAAGWSVNTSSGDIGIIFSGAAGKE